MEKNSFSYFNYAKGAILNPFFVMLITITQMWSQKSNEFIVKLNADTLYTKVIRIDKDLKDVLCEENGKKIKYEAKDIRSFKCDTAFYETGFVRLRKLKSKRYIFLKRTVSGKLNLYEIDIKKTKFLTKTFGYDFIHLRWVYRAQPWFKSIPTTIQFYKKEAESRESYSKSSKGKTKDCQMIQNKIKSEKWTPSPQELVEFYNRNCK